MKIEKMKRNRAGAYIPHKYAEQIIDTICDEKMPEEFIDGAVFAVAYLSCPEGTDMHGATAAEFLENYLHNLNSEKVPPEVLSAAQAVIEQLKAAGIHVVDATIVRGDR